MTFFYKGNRGPHALDYASGFWCKKKLEYYHLPDEHELVHVNFACSCREVPDSPTLAERKTWTQFNYRRNVKTIGNSVRFIYYYCFSVEYPPAIISGDLPGGRRHTWE